MSQSSVLEWLKEHPNSWYSSNQIIESIKEGTANIRTNLMKLRATNFIDWKLSKNSKNKTIFLYRYRK